MNARLKRWLCRLLDVEPEAVIALFWSGDPLRCRRMAEEVRELIPDRRRFLVTVDPAAQVPGFETIVLAPGPDLPLAVRHAFRRHRVALTPVLFDGTPHPLRAAAWALTPGRILAYNRHLERHHLRLRTFLASWLFLRGVPLDRIFLRPAWLFPFRRDRTRVPRQVQILEGRPPSPARRRAGIVTPYLPYPLTHGGAVRMFHLIREAAKSWDIEVFAFARAFDRAELKPLLELCARLVMVEPPHYREPRWSTWRPPEAGEFDSPAMRAQLEAARPALDLVQVEFTQLAAYPGDVLVEHDLTQDLYRQVYERAPRVGSWWDWQRWRWFEDRALRRFPAVVVMSDRDAREAARRGAARVAVLPNGVDLERFRPEPEPPEEHVLFVGSFNHFPNVEAFRFFFDEVWPQVWRARPRARWTVVAGRDHLAYWRNFTGADLPAHPAVEIHGFVRDVRPLYAAANLVVVPTPVSAGTNLKVLEGMAMQRAIVSTACGCAGLGLRDGEHVVLAETAEAFAAAVIGLLEDPAARARLGLAARAVAERDFDWRAIGRAQERLWTDLAAARQRPKSGG
jgi:glycosyltransferase involved in cell wall biosynthesis